MTTVTVALVTMSMFMFPMFPMFMFPVLLAALVPLVLPLALLHLLESFQFIPPPLFQSLPLAVFIERSRANFLCIIGFRGTWGLGQH